MRYFAELSYRGTRYHGWQKQHNALSVQQAVEQTLSTVIGVEEIVGCGRTDAGVHASQYFIHFETDNDFPEGFLRRINKLLPEDIAIRCVVPVHAEAHARFDAEERCYTYNIIRNKDPFRTDLAWHFPFVDELDKPLMQDASELLLNYKAFSPFCKTNNDLKTLRCNLKESSWETSTNGEELIYRIRANRFLRGMVRLIVGMCLNVGLGKLKLSEVKNALDRQQPIQKSWSVPAHGLFLTGVKYPFIEEEVSRTID